MDQLDFEWLLWELSTGFPLVEGRPNPLRELELTRRIVRCAVVEWPEVMVVWPLPYKRDEQRELIIKRVKQRYRYEHGLWEYLLMLLLSKLVEEVVRRLIEWWLSRPDEHHSQLLELQARLKR